MLCLLLTSLPSRSNSEFKQLVNINALFFFIKFRHCPAAFFNPLFNCPICRQGFWTRFQQVSSLFPLRAFYALSKPTQWVFALWPLTSRYASLKYSPQSPCVLAKVLTSPKIEQPFRLLTRSNGRWQSALVSLSSLPF